MRIQGAVIRKDADPPRQLPISGAMITATTGNTRITAQSDGTGYFKISFPAVVWPGQTVKVHVAHAGYEPVDLSLQAGIRLASKELLIAAMKPLSEQLSEPTQRAREVVSNIRVRYSFNSESDVNIGSEVTTFLAESKANVPCDHQSPCSPDGAWKASTGSLSLDAGSGNEFRDVRVSCIAGPCPFTKINDSGFINGGRQITASAISWSGTATFLLEAEVYQVSIASKVREAYPVIFGQVLNFTVPPTNEGVSIEAEINGTPMVFPLGPELYLSWATCTARTGRQSEQATAYRCELKPGYRF
ncbi:MAG TPA: carboxypeptidase-like regulatory domain-containing protein [Terracidiphilus sp.]|nr:carboxypeptidase-like regulatory domain-containing protein [Terracidiphilus sp.]